MDSLTRLNAFISERLTAAAVEIFGAVEKTLIEHQREISRSKQEIDHLRSLALWPEVRWHRSAAHRLSPPSCEEEASPECFYGKDQAPELSPEHHLALHVKEENDQRAAQRGASCRQQRDSTVFPRHVTRGHKDLPSHLYRTLHVDQTADVKDEPDTEEFVTSPSSREAEIHCRMNTDLCGLQQETLKDARESTDHAQDWSDEQQYPEQAWILCQEHEDPGATGTKAEKFTSTSPQEEAECEYERPLRSERSVFAGPYSSSHNQTMRTQTFCTSEEKSRDIEGKGSKLSRLARVSLPFYSNCLAPQDEYDENAEGVVNSESLKEHTRIKKRKNSSLRYEEIDGIALEQGVNDPTRERRHTCPMCAKRFKESSHLKEHVRIHTGEKPYQCKLCGMTFRQSGALTLHTRIHTGERPYQCNDCGRRFNRKGDMESHMVTHTGERPHVCVACGKSYRRKSNLNTHLKSHAEGRKHYTQPL